MESEINVSFYNSVNGKYVCLDYALYPGPVGGGHAGKNIEEAVFSAAKLLKEYPINKITLQNKVKNSFEIKYDSFTNKQLRKFKRLLKEQISINFLNTKIRIKTK